MEVWRLYLEEAVAELRPDLNEAEVKGFVEQIKAEILGHEAAARPKTRKADGSDFWG